MLLIAKMGAAIPKSIEGLTARTAELAKLVGSSRSQIGSNPSGTLGTAKAQVLAVKISSQPAGIMD